MKTILEVEHNTVGFETNTEYGPIKIGGIIVGDVKTTTTLVIPLIRNIEKPHESIDGYILYISVKDIEKEKQLGFKTKEQADEVYTEIKNMIESYYTNLDEHVRKIII